MKHPTLTAEAQNTELAQYKRAKKGIGRSGKTPMAAIRNKCLDCCCYLQAEVRECQASDCPLHPYRFGKRPGTVMRRRGDDA